MTIILSFPKKEQAQFVFLEYKPMFEENHPAKNSYDSFDISPFIKWLTESVQNFVKQIENGTYNETISDYMNIELYEDKERWKKVIENATWQEMEKQRLL